MMQSAVRIIVTRVPEPGLLEPRPPDLAYGSPVFQEPVKHKVALVREGPDRGGMSARCDYHTPGRVDHLENRVIGQIVIG